MLTPPPWRPLTVGAEARLAPRVRDAVEVPEHPGRAASVRWARLQARGSALVTRDRDWTLSYPDVCTPGYFGPIAVGGGPSCRRPATPNPEVERTYRPGAARSPR